MTLYGGIDKAMVVENKIKLWNENKIHETKNNVIK